MKMPRFQFGLRFFLVVVVACAGLLVFVWEKVNQPPTYRSISSVIGDATYGDVAELDALSLSPAQAMRSVKRDRTLWKHIASDVAWRSIDIEPLETVLQDSRDYPLIGYASIRKRDFRCTLKGVDSMGAEVNAVVIVNRNHFHFDETD